jgi:hypothetical protein
LKKSECHETDLESSSGAENTTKMHSKTSPTQLEGSRGPNSDPKIRDFHAGNRPVKSPPASTIARPPQTVLDRIGSIASTRLQAQGAEAAGSVPRCRRTSARAHCMNDSLRRAGSSGCRGALYSPRLEFHSSLLGARPRPRAKGLLTRSSRAAYAYLTGNLHAACAAGAPLSCLRKRLRTTYPQGDVAYARVGIGLLTRKLTRSLCVSKRCLRTQRKRYETLGTYYRGRFPA